MSLDFLKGILPDRDREGLKKELDKGFKTSTPMFKDGQPRSSFLNRATSNIGQSIDRAKSFINPSDEQRVQERRDADVLGSRDGLNEQLFAANDVNTRSTPLPPTDAEIKELTKEDLSYGQVRIPGSDTKMDLFGGTGSIKKKVIDKAMMRADELITASSVDKKIASKLKTSPLNTLTDIGVERQLKDKFGSVQANVEKQIDAVNEPPFIGMLSKDGHLEAYPEAIAKENDYHHSFIFGERADLFDDDSTLKFVRNNGDHEFSIQGEATFDPFGKGKAQITKWANQMIKKGVDPDIPIRVEQAWLPMDEAPFQNKSIGKLSDFSDEAGLAQIGTVIKGATVAIPSAMLSWLNKSSRSIEGYEQPADEVAERIKLAPPKVIDAPEAVSADDIAGFDIADYATDPNHEANVISIYNNVRELQTAEEADNYIKEVMFKRDQANPAESPVKGEDVEWAAKKWGVPIGLLLAIMQQDSSFGTVGLATSTKNPGNVGNNDAGETIERKSWKDGVEAVARYLSYRHKDNEWYKSQQ